MELLTEEKTSAGASVIGFKSEDELKQFVQDTMTEPVPTASPEASPESSPSATSEN
ncbi:hypothetical protein D3C71_2252260 [compost metagenome]